GNEDRLPRAELVGFVPDLHDRDAFPDDDLHAAAWVRNALGGGDQDKSVDDGSAHADRRKRSLDRVIARILRAGPGPGVAAELARVYAQILRDPTNSALNLRYAELAETSGKLRWALAAYERVQVNDPGSAEAQAGLQRVRRRLQPDSTQFTAELGAIGESNPRYLPSGARAEIQGLASLGIRDERGLGDIRWRTTASAFGLLHSNEHDLNYGYIGAATGPVVDLAPGLLFHPAIGGAATLFDNRFYYGEAVAMAPLQGIYPGLFRSLRFRGAFRHYDSFFPSQRGFYADRPRQVLDPAQSRRSLDPLAVGALERHQGQRRADPAAHRRRSRVLHRRRRQDRTLSPRVPMAADWRQRHVDLVAHGRIIEPVDRAEVADAAFAGVDADADVDVAERPPGPRGLAFPLGVEGVQLRHHLQRRFARLLGVRRLVERRVPERHDGIAHVFVDGAAMRQDDLAQRRKQIIDELGELRGREVLRDRREIAHVAEHQGEFAHFAAEHEPVGIGDDLFDHGGSERAAERGANFSPLRLDPAREPERDGGGGSRQERAPATEGQTRTPTA